MKILYVAKHNSGGNDDEGAIVFALRELGHNIVTMNENGVNVGNYVYAAEGCDLVLFHKWMNLDALRMISCPKAFWYFDLVDSRDPTLVRRDDSRKRWMKDVVPLVDVGFCTDGDWAAPSDKLVWLTQGADGRIVGRGKPKYGYDLVFTGIRAGGKTRESWVSLLKKTYPGFKHFEKGVYREALRDMVASSSIVLAPDGPVTDRYWSNRIYNALGFGAFLIHPWCEKLVGHYEHGRHFMTYRDRGTLFDLINYYLTDPESRREISERGLQYTKDHHLYRHRVESLLAIVKERTNARTHPGPDLLEEKTEERAG